VTPILHNHIINALSMYFSRISNLAYPVTLLLILGYGSY